MSALTRRNFLTGLGAAVGIVAVEPVRRIWVVGAQLSRPGDGLVYASQDAAVGMRLLGEAGFNAGETFTGYSIDRAADFPPQHFRIDSMTINGQEYAVTNGVIQRNRSSFSKYSSPRADAYVGARAERFIGNSAVNMTYRGVELKPHEYHGRFTVYTSRTPSDKPVSPMAAWLMGEMG